MQNTRARAHNLRSHDGASPQVVLQLTQKLDDPSLPGLSLVALPLGEPDNLRAGDELVVLGFGVPKWTEPGVGGGKSVTREKRRGDARPRYPKFSKMTDESSGRWIETTMDGSHVYSGHSGGPLLGPRGDGTFDVKFDDGLPGHGIPGELIRPLRI